MADDMVRRNAIEAQYKRSSNKSSMTDVSTTRRANAKPGDRIGMTTDDAASAALGGLQNFLVAAKIPFSRQIGTNKILTVSFGAPTGSGVFPSE
jgi:hypothetical protein